MIMVPDDKKLHQQAIELAKTLLSVRVTSDPARICSAESCTGGWVGKVLTEIAGSSAWYDRGFITYSNESKQDLLNVPLETLETYGAVSEQTVCAMVDGALANSRANLALAITGIAGPSGGTTEKPIGLIWFGWAMQLNDADTTVHRHVEAKQFDGDREQVRRQAVLHALIGMEEFIKGN